jgi:hypothetical protein
MRRSLRTALSRGEVDNPGAFTSPRFQLGQRALGGLEVARVDGEPHEV